MELHQDMQALTLRPPDQATNLSATRTSRPSLQTLPAEIRNLIYKTLFVSAGPIEVLCDRRRRIPRGRVPGIQLLITCRQLKFEAAPFIYAHNKFFFHSNLVFSILGLIEFTLRWLSGLGSSCALVARLIIASKNAAGPGRESVGARGLDLLEILRHVWSRDEHELNVSFVYDAVGSRGHIVAKREIGRLDAAFNALSTRRHPDWRTYSNLRSLLTAVTVFSHYKQLSFHISSKLEGGLTRFWSNERGNCINYKVIDSKHVIRTQTSQQPRTISDLVSDMRIERSLMDCFAKPQGARVAFDLNKGTVSEPVPNIAHVSVRFRRAAMERFYWDGFDLILSTRSVNSTFGHYKPLENWLLELRNMPQAPMLQGDKFIILDFTKCDIAHKAVLRYEGASLLSHITKLNSRQCYHTRVRLRTYHEGALLLSQPADCCMLSFKLTLFLERIIKQLGEQRCFLAAFLFVWFDWQGDPRKADLVLDGVTRTITENTRFDCQDLTVRTTESKLGRCEAFAKFVGRHVVRADPSNPKTLLDWLVRLSK